jgi:hypothetical protein
MPAKDISHNITDNKFTESMITTVQKLRSLPEEAFKDDGVLSKIKNVAQSASGAASDGLAAAAKKIRRRNEQQKSTCRSARSHSGQRTGKANHPAEAV